ncbi:hypothetical protein DFP72DRAFT_1136202 [Ephemerocybe angulata]|uniref:CxC5 like cysteine cluster associated with KDZ domain-containing protein n=1 Tax=Ephemerocybe angulata TaxID=980116 RepID=A0A8H6IEL6_9AGAR|nr:hypothetical protein DFP72DRAFT_1136202 [Tulosesus angulatus]
MPLPLHAIVSTLSEYPWLYKGLSLQDVSHFVNICTILKPYLVLRTSVYAGLPLERLPVDIHEFIRDSLCLEDDATKLLWEAFKIPIWNEAWSEGVYRELGDVYIPYFLKEGVHRDIAFHCLAPPTLTCLDPRCLEYPQRGSREHGQPRELVEPRFIKISVFSRDHGPLPAMSVSLYCRGCKTRYCYSYYVHTNATVRTYYPEPRQYIQSTEHVYVDQNTCKLFTSMMLKSWTSASNCAGIFNSSIGQSHPFHHLLPAHYSTRLSLDVELVWNALLLFWLWIDCRENNIVLSLDHNAESHAVRLSKGLKARNDRFVGTGQPEWAHACDLCCWISGDESIGGTRKRAGARAAGCTDCKKPLPNVKSRYCWGHESKLRAAIPKHRALEDWLKEENKAMQKLMRRAARSTASIARSDAWKKHNNAGGDEEETDDEEVEVGEEDLCAGKKSGGNRGLKARFGRRRTHNEELCVASCGVILGRATFYGSEAPNGVRTFLKGLFPTKKSLPRIIWHDNNCRIHAMLENDPLDKQYFGDSLLLVDVFHFNAKHKESDTQCNVKCNPVSFNDAVTSDGTWRFNSSAAEQANAWFGKYHPITREMEAIRYDFFLDEMVKRHNAALVQELESKGKGPYHIPLSELLG